MSSVIARASRTRPRRRRLGRVWPVALMGLSTIIGGCTVQSIDSLGPVKELLKPLESPSPSQVARDAFKRVRRRHAPQ